MPPIVLSPTPTIGKSGLSIQIISFSGKVLIIAAALIHPADPPPTITILFILIIAFPIPEFIFVVSMHSS